MLEKFYYMYYGRKNHEITVVYIKQKKVITSCFPKQIWLLLFFWRILSLLFFKAGSKTLVFFDIPPLIEAVKLQHSLFNRNVWGRWVWRAVFLNSRKKSILDPEKFIPKSSFSSCISNIPDLHPRRPQIQNPPSVIVVYLLSFWPCSDRAWILSVNFIPLVYVSWERLETKIFKSSKPNSST